MRQNKQPTYTGRFAPSPTGPLHFGSMVAAVASYLQARQQQGHWLVRIEDLDPPREIPGAADEILRTLERYGLEWHGRVLYQSERTEAYLAALEQLRDQGQLYPCDCSRKIIADTSPAGRYGPIYQGLCRNSPRGKTAPAALRVRTHDHPIRFTDQLLGSFEQRLESEIGDFVVQRADRLFAYQLAVVVDDAEQGITEVVRGRDLLDNTPRQIHLQQLLGLPTPAYIHLPLALTSQGEKLSKQTGAAAVGGHHPQILLIKVLEFLGQAPPAALTHESLEKLWEWAVAHWCLSRVPTSDRVPPADSLPGPDAT